MDSRFEHLPLLTASQAARLLHISLQTLYNRLSDPETRALMPMRTYNPAAPSRLFFQKKHIDEWFEALACGHASCKGKTGKDGTPKRGRGRPRKAEALVRNSKKTT